MKSPEKDLSIEKKVNKRIQFFVNISSATIISKRPLVLNHETTGTHPISGRCIELNRIRVSRNTCMTDRSACVEQYNFL